jgi:hypothetical protein
MAGRIGIILVHGIGEQKRFAHLDTEIRGIIDGLRRRPSARITVEILGGTAAAYNAEHDTWASGGDPSARITVVEEPGGRTKINVHEVTEINVHEVWWADVNEPYSLAKQVRFWLWGLSVWNFPRSDARPDLPGFANAMLPPSGPDRSCFLDIWVRFQLFLAGLFFLVAAFSLGAAVFLAKRLFGLEAPDFVRVFVNYISGVKLYNQSTRQGSGFLPNPHGFLDTLNDPPRVSIRRRMMQAIVAVAFRPGKEPYDRWYMLAHSLGSLVAFNGIMENGQAFANYLPRETWENLKTHDWAGGPRPSPPQDPPDWVKVPTGPMSPSRPVWLSDEELVYRDKLFANFHGLLTYGSALGKFAELWPVRVPVNKIEPIFRPGTEWINVFDGRDPVGGPLRAFDPALLARQGISPRHCPPLRGFGYRASPVLLLSHIRYLTTRDEPEPQLSDVVAEWLITGAPFSPPAAGTGRWYDMRTYWWRVAGSWLWWIVAFVFLAILGTITAKALLQLLVTSVQKGPNWLSSFATWLVGG